MSSVAIVISPEELDALDPGSAPRFAEVPRFSHLLAPGADLTAWLRRLQTIVQYEVTHSILQLFAIRAHQSQERSLVYFIQCGGPEGPIKIGKSVDPASRQRDLQAANPYQLNLLGVFPGGHELETCLHGWFRHLRLNGEWFRCAPELLGVVAGFHATTDELAMLRYALEAA